MEKGFPAERRIFEMTAKPAGGEEQMPWGVLTSLDIYDCSPRIIQDAGQIRRYVVELCGLIKMKRFGDCNVV